mmetsp:Transcript_2321/g.4392  ORF Transcript_2321/g.4392 Transcript_2321/m.4392 type:complete len:248 (-) Transcript_2321:1023-1766(-)
MNVAIKSILGIHTLLDFFVLICKLFSFFDHLFDLLFCQTTFVICNSDLLAFTSTFVLSTHIENSVRIYFEGDLNLWLATWSRRDSSKLKFTEEVIVLRHWPFALENLDVDRWLIILICGEDLRFLSWDDRITIDEFCHHTAHRLYTQCQRCNIKKQQVLPTLTTEDPCLYCCTVSNCLIRVDPPVGFLSVEEILHELLHLRNPRGATHKHDLIYLVFLQAGILKHLFHRAQCIFEEVVIDFLKTSSS